MLPRVKQGLLRGEGSPCLAQGSSPKEKGGGEKAQEKLQRRQPEPQVASVPKFISDQSPP